MVKDNPRSSARNLNLLCGLAAIILGIVFCFFCLANYKSPGFPMNWVFPSGVVLTVFGFLLVAPDASGAMRQVVQLARGVVSGNFGGDDGPEAAPRPPADSMQNETLMTHDEAPVPVAGKDKLSGSVRERLGFEKAPPALERADTELIRDTLFETTVPTYILNQDFHILDWNPAFEVAFSVDCQKLRRLRHVSQLIHLFSNQQDLMAHGAEVFGGDTQPLVDLELMNYTSPTFGDMVFNKITSRATHPDTGETIGWNVALNVDHVEQRAAYEEALRNELSDQVNWRIYAAAYDNVLNRFRGYRDLVRRHCSAVAARKNILDLGAGTGNVTAELLASGKRVMAIDYNEAMLTRLRTKCRDYSGKSLRVVKQNLESMRLAKSDRGEFDGAIMQNVLYTLNHPVRFLKLVRDALAFNGIIVVSGPRQDTNLDALFSAIRDELRNEPDWEARLSKDFDNVLERNRKLEKGGAIHRFSIDQVKGDLESAGFQVVEQDDTAYAGQAMFLVAKRG